MTSPDADGSAKSTQRFELCHRLEGSSKVTAVELLARLSGLSKARLKDAMNKGAVWLRGARGGRKRLRRATAELRSGDQIELFYDPALLALVPPAAQCLADRKRYSVWYKPPGLLAQGTDFGDHCSLLRLAELQLGRPAFLVHRLDREAAGLMLIAHTAAAAAQLSQLFQRGRVDKGYRIQVRGTPPAQEGRIELPLDEKPAITEYRVELFERETAVSTVGVTLLTGRLHQIRRHFASIGCAVLGDPRYGQGNKDAGGLRLVAVRLAFTDPLNGRDEQFVLPAELQPF